MRMGRIKENKEYRPPFRGPQTQPRILCLDFSSELPGLNLAIGGIRRHAKARGWGVATFSRNEVPAGAVPSLLARLRPVGCIVSDFHGDGHLPPRLFGDTPVVYLDTPGKVKWRGAMSVVCDNAAVARAAFDELAAGLPESFAFVPSESLRPWNAERGAVFRALCAKAGKPCHAFQGHRGESRQERLARLGSWVSKLPVRCAVFAANDNTACDVAAAFAAVHRAVPRENTIVGADGGDTASEGRDISRISSVKIDKDLSGWLAARMLGDIISHKDSETQSATFGPLLVLRRASTRGHGRREPYILEAMEMIRREACDGLAAATLAKRFPCSRNLFERRFREAMGHSVLDEILHVRLQQVQVLLARPEMPISAIADFCGFDSSRELRQLFLRRFRCSMRQWRKDRFK